MNIKTEHEENYMNATHNFRTTVPKDVILNELPYAIFQEVVRQVADIVAKQVIEEKLSEILEKVTPSAIATMAIAEAGAAINETLHKKMPDKILEIEKHNKEVWVQPFFGRAKRIG